MKKNILYDIEHYKTVYYLHNLLTKIKRNKCSYEKEVIAGVSAPVTRTLMLKSMHFFSTECMQRGSLHKVCIFCMLLSSAQVYVAYEEQLHSFSYPILQLFIFTTGKFQENL